MILKSAFIALLAVLPFIGYYTVVCFKYKLSVKQYFKRLGKVYDIDFEFSKRCIEDHSIVEKYLLWDMDRCFLSGMLFDITSKEYVTNYLNYFDTHAKFHVLYKEGDK